MHVFLSLFLLVLLHLSPLLCCFAQAATPQEKNSALPQLEPGVVEILFSGKERLHYAISWNGGVKIGDIWLEISQDGEKEDSFVIVAKVRSTGPLHLFYSINDTFRCQVSGPMYLPTHYEVHQKEGSRKTHRLTFFDQKSYKVRYRKNKEKWQEFSMLGKVYNEMSAFMITRALRHRVGMTRIVPTFAEKRYHNVKVACTKKEYKKSIFGQKNTFKVTPKLPFKGVYGKEGETVLYITDDLCRVPVELHAKIPVGSLVAELVEYSNPACK